MFPSNSPAPTPPANAPVSPTPQTPPAHDHTHSHAHSHSQPHTHVSQATLIAVLTRALDDKQREVDGLNREVEHLKQHLAKAGHVHSDHSAPRQAVPAPAMMPMPTPTPMPFRVEEGSSKGKGKEKAHFPAADMMGFDSDLLQALDDYKLNGSPQQAENIKARLDAEIAQVRGYLAGSGYALPDMLPMSSLAHQSPRDQLEEEYERAIAESEKLLQSPSSVLRSSPPWRPHTHAQSHMHPHVHGHAKIPELAPGPRNDAFLAQLTRQMLAANPGLDEQTIMILLKDAAAADARNAGAEASGSGSGDVHLREAMQLVSQSAPLAPGAFRFAPGPVASAVQAPASASASLSAAGPPAADKTQEMQNMAEGADELAAMSAMMSDVEEDDSDDNDDDDGHMSTMAVSNSPSPPPQGEGHVASATTARADI
ncbi:hypothetical protein MIND_00192800 [Mycena indigotica]|uniref:Uncharacterized protein n=1 Tax=Mycena indigotica TaxID=2126181 RepID=A0A8H6WEG3_9AGAR|nr:uncharacterized protein MIND_00192800 [Mycena indigotica]KAF7311823.1 hypothetical protein MIND_00192800 [Mycena indigotica]